MVVKRGKEALLLWCKAHTHGYEHVEINDFTTSWQNGMAFCALLHKFYPDMIDYQSLKPSNAEANLKLAFDVGSKVGIPILLEVSEVAEANEASMLTYIAKYYWVFKDRTGSRVKLKSSSSTVSPVAPPKDTGSKTSSSPPKETTTPPESSSSETPSSTDAQPQKTEETTPSPTPSPSSSSSSSSSGGASTAPKQASQKRERAASKKLVGHIVPKDDLEYAEAVESMVKQLKEKIIPEIEGQISGLFENKPTFAIEVNWESFTKSLPDISDDKTKEQAKGNTSPGARQAWRAVKTLYDQNGKLLMGEVASVIEQFLSGHAELGKDIHEKAFNKIRIENIPIEENQFDDDEDTESAQKFVVEKRDTVIKDGLWLIKAPFSVKTSKGPFARNELLVILLDLFGIVSGSENVNKTDSSEAKDEDKNAEAKDAFQKKTWRQTRSLKEIGRQVQDEGAGGWQEGKAKSQLGELVWMEISIPAIARQLRVQYPLSTTIGQIKNYLKTQFAEEMQNLYALYAYELCHLRSVTSGGDDVWLLYADSNLHTYNIQNNDVLEFAMDEEQVQERKPIELEGYLQKEGQKGLMKLWKHRWFSTQDNRLLYFHSETSTDPVGFIPLTQIVSIGSSTHAAHANNRSVFEIKTTQRIYYLLAECEEDKETWIAGLTNSMTYWKSNSMQWTQQWKEGFLVKRGAFRHNWLKRWFMLRDEFLFYYEAKDGSHYLRGKIPLYGVTVEEIDKKKDSSQFFFNVTTAGRVFQLASETEEERRGWMRAIQLQGQLFSSRIDAITET